MMAGTGLLPFAWPGTAPSGAIHCLLRERSGFVSSAELFGDVASAGVRLAALGLGAGDFVGIVGDNGYQWVVHDLALLAVGCIPVSFPETLLASGDVDALADRFALSLLLVSGRCAVPDRDWAVRIDGSPGRSAARRRRPVPGELHRLAQMHDLCGVIFSSGSSGALKAITLSRRGVEAVLDSFLDAWAIAPDDRIFVGLPLSIFQQRVLAYSALRAGADICLTEPSLLFHGLKRLRPSVVLAPPSLFETIEDRGGDAASTSAAFGGGARLLLTGSAPSRPSTWQFYARAGLALYQVYGMAEVGFIAWNQPGADRPSTVGRPVVPGSVEIAADGEILVDVPHRQAIGYYGVPAGEAEATFRPDGRVATGDLGAFDADGFLTITGRKKNLLVTRSGQKFAVEPIEAALRSISGVRHAVVLGGGDFPSPVAVLAVGPELAGPADGRSLSERARTILADHNAAAPLDARIGRILVTEEEFTAANGLLTRNAKIDRARVASHFRARIRERADGC